MSNVTLALNCAPHSRVTIDDANLEARMVFGNIARNQLNGTLKTQWSSEESLIIK